MVDAALTWRVCAGRANPAVPSQTVHHMPPCTHTRSAHPHFASQDREGFLELIDEAQRQGTLPWTPHEHREIQFYPTSERSACGGVSPDACRDENSSYTIAAPLAMHGLTTTFLT